MHELRLNPVYYSDEHLALRESVRRFVRARSPARRRLGRGGRLPARAVPQGCRGGPARARISRGVRRHARRGLLPPPGREHRARAVGLGRRRGLAHVAHHRLAAGSDLWQPGAQGPRAAKVLAGECIAALAITEPSAARTSQRCARGRARRRPLRGEREKTFITSGVRADYLTVAVRTDRRPRRGGAVAAAGEGDTPGLTRSPLAKMGWWSSDTAHLRFEDCAYRRAT